MQIREAQMQAFQTDVDRRFVNETVHHPRR